MKPQRTICRTYHYRLYVTVPLPRHSVITSQLYMLNVSGVCCVVMVSTQHNYPKYGNPTLTRRPLKISLDQNTCRARHTFTAIQNSAALPHVTALERQGIPEQHKGTTYHYNGATRLVLQLSVAERGFICRATRRFNHIDNDYYLESCYHPHP